MLTDIIAVELFPCFLATELSSQVFDQKGYFTAHPGRNRAFSLYFPVEQRIRGCRGAREGIGFDPSPPRRQPPCLAYAVRPVGELGRGVVLDGDAERLKTVAEPAGGFSFVPAKISPTSAQIGAFRGKRPVGLQPLSGDHVAGLMEHRLPRVDDQHNLVRR
jgi:hypothetical protein